MSILSGYKKVKDRILTSSGYQLLSRWTSSNTVDFDDGKTAQTKVGAINGIIKDKNSLSTVTDDSFAAGAVAVKDAIADVNGKLKSVDYDITFPSGVTTDFVHCKRTGNIVDFGFRILSGSIPYGSPLATLPADLHPKYNILIPSQYLVINDVASTGNVGLMYNGSIFQEYSATGTLNACVIKGTFII